MSEGNSIINLGDVAKPADTLIKKVSHAIGGYFKPYQIKRVAKAEAEAALIKAESEIEITDLHRRAMTRFIAEEAKKQENIEKITEKAIPMLDQKATPESLEDDWITNFFDKSRLVSDEQMQDLWAKVLSGEANAPGSFSKRTVDFIGSLDRSDADAFERLMRFSWSFGEPTPLVYEIDDVIYKDAGITFSLLTHLDDIGLISFQSLSGFKRMGFPKKCIILYFDRSYLVEFEKDENNEIKTGKVLLTKTGKQLAKVCRSSGIDGFPEYVATKWAAQKISMVSMRTKR